jgi:hypothetical protein
LLRIAEEGIDARLPIGDAAAPFRETFDRAVKEFAYLAEPLFDVKRENLLLEVIELSHG